MLGSVVVVVKEEGTKNYVVMRAWISRRPILAMI